MRKNSQGPECSAQIEYLDQGNGLARWQVTCWCGNGSGPYQISVQEFSGTEMTYDYVVGKGRTDTLSDLKSLDSQVIGLLVCSGCVLCPYGRRFPTNSLLQGLPIK